MADKDYSPEFFDKFAKALDAETDLEEVYNKVFAKEDYKKECLPYLLALLNSPVPSRRYNAVSFLEDYYTKEVGIALEEAYIKETNNTVKNQFESTMEAYYKIWPELHYIKPTTKLPEKD